jgi:hypothetical protein
MALLGALLSELAFLGASLALMALALRRRPAGGLFSALLPGALPALALAGLVFWQLQQPGDPEVKEVHQTLMDRFDQVAAERLNQPDQAEERQQLKDMGEALFSVMPALEMTLRLALLAPLAAWLRRRKARAGLAPDPGSLWQWGAPWWLAWALLGPLFWLLLRRAALAQGPAWADPLAWNLLVLGGALQCFHGAVALLGKLIGWWGQARTRPLVFFGLTLALITLTWEPWALVAMAALTGLFDPWLDLRRLHRPPSGEPLDKGGEA